MFGFVTKRESQNRLSTGLVLLFSLVASACNWNVGSVELRLVYTSDVNRNPLSVDLIKTLRIRIQGEGMSSREAEFDLHESSSALLADIPLGTQRVVTVGGYNSAGELMSRGISAPFETMQGTKKIYLFISRVGRFSPPPSGITEEDWTTRYKSRMATSRVFHAATLLPNGLVLVTGGTLVPNVDDFLSRVLDQDQSDPALRSVERLDSTSGAFLLEPEPADCSVGKLCLRARRAFHCAMVMPQDGLVLLAGGEPLEEQWPGEYYHIESNRFETKESLLLRTRHACVALNGTRPGVLVAGGTGLTPSTLLDSVEFVGEEGLDELPGVQLVTARTGARAVAYPGGALIIGGWDQWEPRRASAQVDHIKLDEQGASASSFELLYARAEHSAVLLEDPGQGPKILVCGGLAQDLDSNLQVVGSCEILDVESESSWELQGVDIPVWAHTATALPTGRMLLAGGFSIYAQVMSANNHAVLFENPLTGPARRVIPMVAKRAGHTASLLPNGMVALIGGVGAMLPPFEVQMASQDYEIYNPQPE